MVQSSATLNEVYPSKGSEAPVNGKASIPAGAPVPTLDQLAVEEFHKRRFDLGNGKMAYGLYVFKFKITQAGGVTITLDGVSFQAISTLLALLGYRKRYIALTYQFVCVRDNIMDPVTGDIMKSHIVRIAEAERGSLTIEFRGDMETFGRDTLLEMFRRHVNAILNNSFFETLPQYDVPLLKDSKDIAYFPYANGAIKVTPQDISLIPYTLLAGLTLWRSHINPRVFEWVDPTPENCPVVSLVKNLTSGDPVRLESFRSGIGYALHNYNHSALGRAWMLYDEKPTRKGAGNGGTGKGIILQMLSKMRETAILDGKSFDRSNPFCFQGASATTQILALDDVKSDMDFTMLYSMITEGITIEKKYEQAIRIPPAESPKIVITSNNIVGGLGTSDTRRQFISELSDYYSSRIRPGGLSPVEQEHGILFADDVWTAGQWSAFYCFMLQCVQLYLQRGLVGYELRNVTRNRILQHCGEDFTTWVFNQAFCPGIEYNLDQLYADYRDTYYGEGSTKFTLKTFGNHIKMFGEVNGWEYSRRRSHHINYFAYQGAARGEFNFQVAQSGPAKQQYINGYQ